MSEITKKPQSRTPLLAESGIEMKCMLFFGIALTVVIAISFFLYYLVTGELVQDQNPLMANVWAQQHLQEKHFDIGRSVQRGPGSIGTGSVLPLAPLPNTDSSDFKSILQEIGNRFRSRDCETNCIPNREKMSDVFLSAPFDELQKKERKAAEDWETFAPQMSIFPFQQPVFDPDAPPQNTSKFDGEKYHYFEEVRMVKPSECSVCHSNFDNGELMGVIHVMLPESSMKRTFQRFWAYLFAAMIISVFLALAAINIVIRWIIIKPLKSLRTVAESISRGELTKRAEIRTGDEFEVLSDTFNRMLSYLVSTQDMLRKTNNELESKVTELAHLTMQLYHTNSVKSDFMATMSHELRTPLNSILGFSDVLGGISTLDDKQKRYVENINKSGKALLMMINDILDMAKMETGRMEVKVTSFSIAATVAGQSDMAKPLVDRKNIELEVSVEPNLPFMKQDESKIHQILNNLLSNAVKFTPEGGRIYVSIRRIPAADSSHPARMIAGGAVERQFQQDILEMKVSDTGVGISEDDRKIIFEKFRQAGGKAVDGETLKREHTGSGLGLSIVKEICKMLEGEISVESSLGVGSTFTVILPWVLEPKARSGNDMTAEIQQFAQNRVNRKPD
ncbi:MAG: HAMP domain-containing histidine kinase [Planctomycetaceae bacterium]|nr:HAMP domain-containing histidine kinase [Planctomycetaceae bacterium]